MPQKSLQTVAAEWHNGQSTALYTYATNGTVQPGIATEIRCCVLRAKAKELVELLRLYVAIAPALSKQDIEINREFWHRFELNSDGTPVRCRKIGAIKTWKTRPSDFRHPVKYGLKTSFYLTPANINEWCLPL